MMTNGTKILEIPQVRIEQRIVQTHGKNFVEKKLTHHRSRGQPYSVLQNCISAPKNKLLECIEVQLAVEEHPTHN